MKAKALLATLHVILACGVSGQAAGQSLLRAPGDSGFGAAATFFASTLAKGMSFEGTWTGWGLVDFTLGTARTSFEAPPGSPLTYTGHQAGAQCSVLAVRQGESVPVSLQVGAGYSLLWYNGDAIGTGADVDGHGVIGAVALARNIRVGRETLFVPTIVYQYQEALITVEAADVEVSRSTSYARVWTGALQMVLQEDAYLAPRIDVSEDAKPTYGLTVGFLFPRRTSGS